MSPNEFNFKKEEKKVTCAKQRGHLFHYPNISRTKSRKYLEPHFKTNVIL